MRYPSVLSPPPSQDQAVSTTHSDLFVKKDGICSLTLVFILTISSRRHWCSIVPLANDTRSVVDKLNVVEPAGGSRDSSNNSPHCPKDRSAGSDSKAFVFIQKVNSQQIVVNS